MKSKSDRAIDFLRNNSHLFICPVCGAKVHLSPPFLHCENKHNFSISHKGVVTLVHTSQLKKSKIYDEELFANRRKFIFGEYYFNIYKAIGRLIAEYAETVHDSSNIILDIGCGEGSHTHFLRQHVSSDNFAFIGFDISKAGVELASDFSSERTFFFVGDITRIPLGDSTVSIALDFLSPYQSFETKRVLKPNGIFIKIVPGVNYLKELRDFVGLTKYDGYIGSQKIVDSGFSIIDQCTIHDRLHVEPNNRDALYHMAPMTKFIDMKPPDILVTLDEITIDLEIICFIKR